MKPEPNVRAKIVLLIDDVRSFADGRACQIARTSGAAVALLQQQRSVYIDEIWLDYDLAGRHSTAYEETAMPVVDELVQAAGQQAPYDVGVIYLHTANPRGGVRMRAALRRAEYLVQRYYGYGWVH